MEYVLTFLEGIMTFISPCILPLLPIYISYFAGQSGIEKEKNNRAIINSIGFVIGFTIVFVLLGAFASTLGTILNDYKGIISVIFGVLIIIFGLQFMEIIKIPFLNRTNKMDIKLNNINFLKSILFGIVFSIGWTPCVGAFLGSALMIVATQGEIVKGILLLLLYSIGLGIPFIISAVLIEKLKGAFSFIKNHYKVVNIISGIILLIMGFFLLFQGYKYLEKEYNKEKNNIQNTNIVEQNEVKEENVIEAENKTDEEISKEDTKIKAINFTVYDENNNEVKLEDYIGKPIVINYWATWCGYCVKEMPTFNKVYEEEKDEVVFMMINATDGVSETVDKAKKFIKENNFQFPVYYDIKEEVGYQYGIYSLPTTIFINKKGEIEIGYKGMLSEEILKKEIQKIKE